jgi:NAD+ kinase
MNKTVVVSKHDTAYIDTIILEHGFKLDTYNPDFVICYGGDGTILSAERMYPNVPKIILKLSVQCREYDYKLSNLINMLNRIKIGKYEIVEEMMLETTVNGKTLVGLNEIQLHTTFPIYALRFTLMTNDKIIPYCEELIGDGIIFSTPFGSTAYYKTTGGKPFTENAIGVSFNNIFRGNKKAIMFSDNTKLQVKLTRGPAWLIADNNNNFIYIYEGDTIEIQKSNHVSRFIVFNKP